MSRNNHNTVFIHDERFSFNGAKILRIQRAYKIRTIASEIDLMTLGKDTQERCSCCQESLVGLFVDRRQHCKCCGSVVCEECNANPAIVEGHECRGEMSVCDGCFAEKERDPAHGYIVKPPTRGGAEDDERCAQLKKGRKVHIIDPVGMVTDSSVDNCMGCNAQFGWTVFKHHCRCCGNVMCSVRLLVLWICALVLSNHCFVQNIRIACRTRSISMNCTPRRRKRASSVIMRRRYQSQRWLSWETRRSRSAACTLAQRRTVRGVMSAGCWTRARTSAWGACRSSAQGDRNCTAGRVATLYVG